MDVYVPGPPPPFFAKEKSPQMGKNREDHRARSLNLPILYRHIADVWRLWTRDEQQSSI